MEGIQSKLSVSTMTAYIGIFKEPRGLIRLLQFIFAIFAFATACSGGSSLNATVGTGSLTASWSYPYNLATTPISVPQGSVVLNFTNQRFLSSSNDIKPSAEFFVFTGVTSMLLSLAFAILYVVMDRQYRNDERLPIIDFVITIIWTIFWLAGSSAWAQGVTNLRQGTSCNNLFAVIPECNNPSGTNNCNPCNSGTYANVIVSVIFGFLNFLLWLGSAWFVYKETKFFKSRNSQQQQQPQQSNFSNIAPPIGSQSQVRPPGVMS